MIKRGWWSIRVELNYEDTPWDCLDKDTQEHIINCIKNGYAGGQIAVETNE